MVALLPVELDPGSIWEWLADRLYRHHLSWSVLDIRGLVVSPDPDGLAALAINDRSGAARRSGALRDPAAPRFWTYAAAWSCASSRESSPRPAGLPRFGASA